MSTSFPSLLITRNGLEPRGPFAVAQATYLHPDPQAVEAVERLCRERRIGIVAHYYMDAELQGVLAACDWPHITIADSLKMADAAVKMAEAGMDTIVVLGVDFMSENARAVLDAAGHADVAVYRAAAEPIGCSLAESAAGPAYRRWLEQARATPRSLHVVYINTSLRTKAEAHLSVPTLTCTSSNVVQSLLQAAHQVDDLHLWYGPDTYMGHNLRTLFQGLLDGPEEAIRQLHPHHDRATLMGLMERFHTFEEGACVVHHLFGAEVVRRVRDEHPDAYYTAHLEVPGEMFTLAAEAAREGRGVVGSTSNILSFIAECVAAASQGPSPGRPLSFVLGTEAGMITAITKRVQELLAEADDPSLAVEIVFPVASEAVAPVPGDLGIVPGVHGGEGCSTAGGCATCPYMKMNTLEALFHVLEHAGEDVLDPFAPTVDPTLLQGRTVAELGSIPILHMRAFQTDGVLPPALIEDILQR